MLLQVDKNTDLEVAINTIHSFAASSSTNEQVAAEVATVASELIYNIVKYGRMGTMKLDKEQHNIIIEAQDSGPGFAAIVESALEEGYSSGGSLGLGLLSIFRMSDDVVIETSEAGTKITCVKRA